MHGLLISIYTAVFLTSLRPHENTLGIPNKEVIFEVNPALNKSIARIYAGEPSDELDTAWHKLMRYANIAIPEQEIRRLDRLDESVRFTDGSGYFGQMTVYHHLHCIQRIHKFLHVDHYWPNATQEELFLLRAHNTHCLDTLRQSVMCQGDTSLITFKWGLSQRVPLGNFSSPHTCRDWSALEEYNKQTWVDVFQLGLVVHPKFGAAYDTDGKGEGKERQGTGVVVEEGV
ncbi:hypothetical protein DL98DRAFT_581719 [Cadophora sp. DSE1049]|nr:hypothetical protein DL98DRAFT_581719 [Cadophora sp. DSE1049]